LSLGRRRALNCHGNNILSPKQNQAKSALLLLFDRSICAGLLGLDVPELLAVTQD